MTSLPKSLAALTASGLCLWVILAGCSSKEPTRPAITTLAVEPTSVNRTTVCDLPIGRSEITVRSRGAEAIPFTATNSKTWLTLSNAADTTPGTVYLNFDVGGLDVGEYIDTVVITSPQANNSVHVEVRLSIGSLIKVSPETLLFRGLVLWENPDPQKLILTDTCETGYDFTITESVSWLSLSPASGTATDTIVASIDMTGLPVGVYTEVITIDAPQAVNTPQQVYCTLTVSSWFPQGIDFPHDLRGVAFIDELHGWAVGIVESAPERTGYILYTTDGGKNWRPDPPHPVSQGLSDVAFIDAYTGWAVGAGGYILHTTDGGITWEEQTSGTDKDLWGLAFAGPDTGWAVGIDGTILHTADGGANWIQQHADPSMELSAVVFVDSRHGWAVGNAGVILHTTNGGDVWTPQSPSVSPNLRDVYFTDADTGWVVGSGGTILRTTDGGENWSKLITGTKNQLAGIYFSGTGRGWAVGEHGTILHTEEGVTWLPQVSGLSGALYDVCFVDDNIGWTVGAKGIIIYTVSGGE